MTAAEVAETLSDGGRAPTVNAIRNHLNRLVDRGLLAKHDDGRYVVKVWEDAPPAPPDDDFPTSPSDDDIPF